MGRGRGIGIALGEGVGLQNIMEIVTHFGSRSYIRLIVLITTALGKLWLHILSRRFLIEDRHRSVVGDLRILL